MKIIRMDIFSVHRRSGPPKHFKIFAGKFKDKTVLEISRFHD